MELKRLGLTLEEIGQVIDLYFEDATGIKGKREVLKILQEQRARIDAQMGEMQSLRDVVDERIRRLQGYIRKVEEG